MIDPPRYRDSAGISPSAQELLRGATKSRSMTGAERLRSKARVARLVSLPLATATWFGIKGVAAASAGIFVVASTVYVTFSPLGGEVPQTSPQKTFEIEAGTPSRPVLEAPNPPLLPLQVPTSEAGHTSESSGMPIKVGNEPTISTAREISATRSQSGAPGERPTGSLPVEARVEPPAMQLGSGGLATTASSVVPVYAPPLASTEESLAKEAALLEEGRTSLAGNPQEALTKLAQHAGQFPNGKLSVEREFLRIEALRRVGRFSEARMAAETLLAQLRGSLYRERVEKMLEQMPR